MKEKALDINRVYWYSLPFIVLGSPIAIVLYQICYGTSYREALYSNPLLLLYFMLAMIGMVISHELIHGLFFALYADSNFKKIKLGILWKFLTPYCHCEEAIKAKQYGIVLLMPTILLGLMPLLIGFVISNFFVFSLGIMMILGGIGDIMAFRMVQKVSADTLVMDHPNKVGFYYKE